MDKAKEYKPDLLARWYAVPDDMIGGWCIMNHPTITPATLDSRRGDPSGHQQRGIACIGDMMFEEAAHHIAKLHNDWLDRA